MNAKYANNRKFSIFTNYSSIDYDINIICENLRNLRQSATGRFKNSFNTNSLLE